LISVLILCLGVGGWNPDGSVFKKQIDDHTCFIFNDGQEVVLDAPVFEINGHAVWRVRYGRFNQFIMYWMD